jgi:hypothetical protein
MPADAAAAASMSGEPFDKIMILAPPSLRRSRAGRTSGYASI